MNKSLVVKYVMSSIAVMISIVHIASAATNTVGKSGADYDNFYDAMTAAVDNDTVQFVDSEVYVETNHVYIDQANLTLESATGEKATVFFTNSVSGVQVYGMRTHASHFTIRNMIIKSERTVALATGDSVLYTNTTVKNVDFVLPTSNTVKKPKAIYTCTGMNISYCTFYGVEPLLNKGYPIQMIADAANVTVNHCSFDQCQIPIYTANANSHLSVYNSAFGQYKAGSSYDGGIRVQIASSTVFEDYNSAYGPKDLVHGDDVIMVTSGGHSIDADAYTDVFTGTTSNGDWIVHSDLHTAASDGTTIGAWQFVAKGTIIIVQ